MTSAQPIDQTATEPASVTVLLVEDEILLRGVVAEYLRVEGFSVLEAGNAAEAKRVLTSSQSIDLVLTDINMPGDENGIDLARHVQAHHPRLPILVLSGNPASHDVNGWPFLNKPFQLQKLLSVARVLLAQQAEDDLNGG